MPAFFKAILPGKFKIAAFKAAIKLQFRGTGDKIKKDFEDTTRGWDRKVRFQVKSSGVFSTNISVTTSDQVYVWLNDGTKAHIIRPRTKKYLKVYTQFQARTSPGSLKSRGTRSYNNPIYTKVAANPGVTPREWDKIIAEKWEDELGEQMELALNKGAIASGHFWGFIR